MIVRILYNFVFAYYAGVEGSTPILTQVIIFHFDQPGQRARSSVRLYIFP